MKKLSYSQGRIAAFGMVAMAAALAAVHHGAAIVRAHDVAATVDALKVWQAVANGQLPKA